MGNFLSVFDLIGNAVFGKSASRPQFSSIWTALTSAAKAKTVPSSDNPQPTGAGGVSVSAAPPSQAAVQVDPLQKLINTFFNH